VLPAPQGPVYQPIRKSGVGRVLLIVAAIGIIGLAGLGMVALLGLSLGPVPFALAVSAAALPVPLLILSFRWLDRYEPEPWKYLAFAFGWGACVATLVAAFANDLLGAGIGVITGESDSTVDTLTAVLVAPPVEETGKGLAVLLLFLFRRKEIHGIVDGIVYAGMAAIGFAFTENILYFGRVYSEVSDEYGAGQGIVGLVLIFALRAVLSPFAHPLFTCLFGIGIGFAARSNSWAVRIGAPLAGFLLAMLMHGTWNLFASSGDVEVLAVGYFGIMVPAFFAMVGIAVWVRSLEAKAVGRALPPYVAAGWLTQPEVAALSTMSGRQAARRWARMVAGDEGRRWMKDYQYAATRLALLRDGLSRGFGGAEFPGQERELLGAMTAQRQKFLRFSPVGPVPPPSVWGGPGGRPPGPGYGQHAPGPAYGQPGPGYGPAYGQPGPGYGPGPGYRPGPGYGPAPGQPYPR